jgi:hypothetical protein
MGAEEIGRREVRQSAGLGCARFLEVREGARGARRVRCI